MSDPNWRPFAYGETWDKMSSEDRRTARRGDIYLGFGGAVFIAFILPTLMHWIIK